MKTKELEIVICAAIQLSDGRVFRGHRHGDCFYTMVRAGIDKQEAANAEQGFITSRNRFVSREEGRRLQDQAGIPSASPDGYQANTLFSEDLY